MEKYTAVCDLGVTFSLSFVEAGFNLLLAYTIFLLCCTTVCRLTLYTLGSSDHGHHVAPLVS